MEWIEFISTCVKFVDLHDSNREIGTASQPPPEDRSGRKDALWFNVGVSLIEFLYEQDQETNDGWIYLGRFIKKMIKTYSISEDDVFFVVQHLSTPSRLNAIKDNAQGQPVTYSTKKTTLIERPRNKSSDRCRLTDLGRTAIQTAKIANNFIYAKHDAEKLYTAIIAGDYRNLETQSRLIVQSIRKLSQELIKIREGVTDDELRKFFSSRLSDYGDSTEGVSQAVEKAHQLFNTPNEIERFESWLELQTKPFINAYGVSTLFKNIIANSFELRDKITKLTTLLMDENRSVVGNTSFDKVALYLALNPPSDRDVELNFNALSPWSVNACLPSLLDFEGIIAPVEEIVHKEVVFKHSNETTLPLSIERFLERYSGEIAELLNVGDLSLTKAISMGFLELDSEESISDLVGIYTTPLWLEGVGENVAIKLDNQSFGKLGESAEKNFYGHELFLTKQRGITK